MNVDFICDEDENVINLTYTLAEGSPKECTCDKCGKPMRKIFGASKIVPEWFSDHTTTTIAQKMSVSLPSGKDKVLF